MRRCAVVRGRGVEGGEHACDDVVDIGEVALHVAVVEHRDALAGGDPLAEDVHRHVGPPPRPVHREEAQSGLWDAIEVAVGEAHVLAAEFGRGIQRDRLLGAVPGGEWELGVAAIDRR